MALLRMRCQVYSGAVPELPCVEGPQPQRKMALSRELRENAIQPNGNQETLALSQARGRMAIPVQVAQYKLISNQTIPSQI